MDGDSCPLLDELASIPPNLKGAVNGVAPLLNRFAERGRGGLTSDLFHEVDKQNGIWEFIKGRIRILCFMSPYDGTLIILTHSFIKKEQKTPKSEVSKAIRLLEVYKADFLDGEVELVEEERSE